MIGNLGEVSIEEIRVDEGRQIMEEDLATEKTCVWWAVLTRALLPVWLFEVRQGMGRGLLE